MVIVTLCPTKECVGAFMADLVGRRSVLFPKIQRRYEIFGEERSLYEVLVWEAFPHVL
jgi:hypothetical protein